MSLNIKESELEIIKNNIKILFETSKTYFNNMMNTYIENNDVTINNQTICDEVNDFFGELQIIHIQNAIRLFMTEANYNQMQMIFKNGTNYVIQSDIKPPTYNSAKKLSDEIVQELGASKIDPLAILYLCAFFN